MYSCNLCDNSFESNFKLYQHKAKNHGPALGIVVKDTNEQAREGGDPAKNRRTKYRKLLDGSDDVKGTKRPRPHGIEPPKKYRKVEVLGSDDDGLKTLKNDQGGVKRDRSSDDEIPEAKRIRIDNRGLKRRRVSKDGAAKRRKIEKRGRKRYNSNDAAPSPKRANIRSDRSDGSDGSDTDNGGALAPPSSMKRVRSDSEDGPSKHPRLQGVKRYYSDSHDDLPASKRGRVGCSDQNSTRLSLIDKLKREIEKWKRLYRTEKRKYEECDAKIKDLDRQLAELKEFGQGDYELDTISKSVINSVSIDDYIKIRDLISKNKLSSVLRSRKYLLALRKIFTGLSYGIIPVTSPQRIALSQEEKDMVTQLENATAERIRLFIKERKTVFLKLFSVVNDSIKLVVKSFSKYRAGK